MPRIVVNNLLEMIAVRDDVGREGLDGVDILIDLFEFLYNFKPVGS
jgi:hypothetical protein